MIMRKSIAWEDAEVVPKEIPKKATQSNEQVTISNRDFLSSYRNELASFCRTYKYPFFKLNSTNLTREEAVLITLDVVNLWISCNS